MLDHMILPRTCSVRKRGLIWVVTSIHVHTLCQKSLNFIEIPVPCSNYILYAKRKLVHVLLLEKILKHEVRLKVK